ncbi:MULTISPECIES: aromatic ring-hydroxylating dioxygenase subunit alpha [unclassified Pseudofrankia]|uniref:aromatic ring-hydroxylating dioxygenase subunit alpha n=1 Tax=unclassified Pseudofrankia TaxID=2994372 RepID=UPI0008DAD6A7|nr:MULTISPECIES: aromatic ring-hydroxylating dioxygenase subunit alpha [unclassified Pseudofrankia]MDT3446707.1 aromatic ring-hydroxylating dioxygenase subunit alpha [Pseudofrankia sp. BMG5.37]OHV57530.1 hypothetical protein BCD48_42980 [Pseudofrankia sp. BMG5.36]
MGVDARPETLPLGSAPTFPRRMWWVAARSSEVGDELLARRIADLPMVFYRTRQGTAVALADMCPHRWLPLSKGCREGDQIRCGYHGMLFSPDGSCADVPSQPEAAAGAAVRTYAVVERGPWIWVWTGDREEADPAEIPAYPWLMDPDWDRVDGYMPLAANYLRGHENVLDLSHFSYLHPGTVGTDEWTKVRPIIRVEDGVLYELRDLPAAAAPPSTAVLGVKPGSLVDRRNESRVPTPALHIATTTLRSPAGDGHEYHGAILHAFTPATERTTHYFFAAARDWQVGDSELNAKIQQIAITTFGQDKDALEAVEEVALTHPGELHELSVRSDKSGLRLRRLIKQRLLDEAEEQGAS